MFHLQVLEEPGFHYTQNVLDEIVRVISNTLDIPQNGILNIVFMSPESIQNLNKTYRNIDASTDVLSFHYYDDFFALGADDIAGELVFCEEKIISQGEEYGLGSENEFYKLVIHSVLHILGFDHEDDSDYEEMKNWEELLWRQVFGE